MTQALAEPTLRPLPLGAIARRRNRAVYAIVLAVTLPVLILANALHADPSGVGTHTQLGLSQCNFIAHTGYPCATCGYTTAFTHAAHGNLLEAFRTQPAGAALAVATTMFALLSAWGLFTGAAIMPWARLMGRFWFLMPAGVLFVGGWVYKILVVRGVL